MRWHSITALINHVLGGSLHYGIGDEGKVRMGWLRSQRAE